MTAVPSPYQQIFDALPMMAFVVDDDVRIVDMNRAAEQTFGSDRDSLRHLRSGDALHCVNAREAGCGAATACQGCVIRNAVNSITRRGRPTVRKQLRLQLNARGKDVSLDLVLTASPLTIGTDRRTLLLLEDHAEVERLRDIIPICMGCRQVRNDASYWQHVETYVAERFGADFSHGVCPDCAEQYRREFEHGTAPLR